MSSQQVKLGRPKDPPPANLSSVTPAPPPRPAMEMDTTTPRDTSIVPFQMSEFVEWHPHLLRWLSHVWPHITSANLPGKVNEWCSSNEFHFVRTQDAVGLADMTYHPINPRPIVRGIFCLTRKSDGKDDLHDMLKIYRSMMAWGRAKGAYEFQPGNVSHLDLSVLISHLTLDQRTILFRKIN